jgi:glucan phosphorylase
MKVKTNNANFPAWKEVTTMAKVPAKLEKLQVLARNLWWVWNDEATDLFKEIDGAAWDEAGRNPVLFFEKVSIETLEKVEKDSALIKKIDSIPIEAFQDRIEEPVEFIREHKSELEEFRRLERIIKKLERAQKLGATVKFE